MKAVRLLIIAAAILLCLSACLSQEVETTYTKQLNGTTYTIDSANKTISDGEYTYSFTTRPYGSGGYEINITYPNGSTYWWQSSGNFAHGGWSDDYDDTKYARGDDLCEILGGGMSASQSGSDKNVGVIFILLLIGVFNTAAPRTAWYLGYGWRFKDAEPSEAALFLNRAGGILALVIAVFMIIL